MAAFFLLLGTIFFVVGLLLSDMPTIVRSIMITVAVLALAGGAAFPYYYRWRFGRNAYAVTTRRALSWDTNLIGAMRFQEYDAADLARMKSFKIGRIGVGSLIFAREVNRKQRRVVRVHGFQFIPDVALVEKLLRERLIDPYTDRLYK